jgi:hypothetical protein
MGASGWFYFVPYQQDTKQALQELRQLVFTYLLASGEFISCGEYPTPKTIEEALAQAGDDGTHSILDVDHVDPFPQEAYLECFGTEQPTRVQVECAIDGHETWQTIRRWMQRWEGYSIIIYDQGIASEIVFVGVSGD